MHEWQMTRCGKKIRRQKRELCIACGYPCATLCHIAERCQGARVLRQRRNLDIRVVRD